jgi:hypothetical protein
MTIKDKRAVKSFRKNLDKLVRTGKATVRVFGSKGNWYLGVQINDTIHRYSVSYMTMITATMHGYQKFGVKASQYKGRALAA